MSRSPSYGPRSLILTTTLSRLLPAGSVVGAEGQRTMGGGKRPRIVGFATGGKLPVKRFPVPACEALFRTCVRPR